MSVERVEALESIGFRWSMPKPTLWWKRFSELEEYKQEHGDCNVPQEYRKNPQLGVWARNQRMFYKQNKMNAERIEALESIGFEWSMPTPTILRWKRFGELEEYKREHGDCIVPRDYKKNPQLASWVGNQRSAYARSLGKNQKGILEISAERVEALNNIGFEWKLRDRLEWDERYDELVAYKQKHGDTLVPYKPEGLALWVTAQRTQYRLLKEGKHSVLTEDRVKKLNSIGFVWNTKEAAWEEHFAELLAYKEMHGDTLVSEQINKRLAVWVVAQRTQYRLLKEEEHSFLTDDRVEKLDSIGFVWRPYEAAWEAQFNNLAIYWKENGICKIPYAKTRLYTWARQQLRNYRKIKDGTDTVMSKERIEALERIGFFDVYGN